jgi:hypothetical protein
MAAAATQLAPLHAKLNKRTISKKGAILKKYQLIKVLCHNFAAGKPIGATQIDELAS